MTKIGRCDECLRKEYCRIKQSQPAVKGCSKYFAATECERAVIDELIERMRKRNR